MVQGNLAFLYQEESGFSCKCGEYKRAAVMARVLSRLGYPHDFFAWDAREDI